jgi:hypothetical protein
MGSANVNSILGNAGSGRGCSLSADAKDDAAMQTAANTILDLIVVPYRKLARCCLACWTMSAVWSERVIFLHVRPLAKESIDRLPISL